MSNQGRTNDKPFACMQFLPAASCQPAALTKWPLQTALCIKAVGQQLLPLEMAAQSRMLMTMKAPMCPPVQRAFVRASCRSEIVCFHSLSRSLIVDQNGNVLSCSWFCKHCCHCQHCMRFLRCCVTQCTYLTQNILLTHYIVVVCCF